MSFVESPCVSFDLEINMTIPIIRILNNIHVDVSCYLNDNNSTRGNDNQDIKLR